MKQIRLLIVTMFAIDCMARRGPHHPHSTVDRHKQQHAHEHLTYQNKHIEEDLSEQKVQQKKPIEELTEDEKNYLYFKVHDLDGNDKLDGLEIYYSATHHSESQNVDGIDEEDALDGKSMNSENVITVKLQPSMDDDQLNAGKNPSKQPLHEKDNNEEQLDENFNHIIEILDNFLDIADLNQDGFLNFPEYAAAVKLGNAMAGGAVNEFRTQLNEMYYY